MSSLLGNSVVLMLTNASNHNEAACLVLRYFMRDKNLQGIYVCVNRVPQSISADAARMGLDTQKLFFVDCTGTSGKVGDKILRSASPENLDRMGKALADALNKASGAKFLIFDSVSALLMFNNFKSVAQFGHLLTNLVREHGLQGVILTIERDTHEFVQRTLNVLSDRIIQV